MRTNPNSRQITVDKAKLIEKIKENKAKHIQEYEEAVIAYKKKADELLNKAALDLAAGKMDIRINLVTPVNESAEYDKLVDMFTWEVEEKVVLSQGEFNEYVFDETPFAVQAKMLNSSYR